MGSCALKRGALQSMYLPQLLSMIRFIGGCPSKWLRVVQAEQLFLRPAPVLRALWRWLGVDGPLTLNHTSRGLSAESRESTHRRRHLLDRGIGANDPPLMAELHDALSQWNFGLFELFKETGIDL